jgi:hypothetical protein
MMVHGVDYSQSVFIWLDPLSPFESCPLPILHQSKQEKNAEHEIGKHSGR